MTILWSNASSALVVDYPVSYGSSDASNYTIATTPTLNLPNLTPGTFYSVQVLAIIKAYPNAQSSPPLQCSNSTGIVVIAV